MTAPTDELTELIDRICRAVGIDPASVAVHTSGTPPFPPGVMRELQHGNKIGAIKEYRLWTNAGLREAKDAIDDYEAGRPPAADARYAVMDARYDALKARLDAILATVETGR